MAYNYVAGALRHLSSMEKVPQLPDSINQKIKAFQVEFRFLKIFLLCFPQWDCDADLHLNLSSIATTICRNEGTDFYAAWIAATIHGKFAEFHSMAARMKDKIQECKAKIKKYHQHLISCSLKSEPFAHNETMKFLDAVHVNMYEIVKCEVDKFLPVKNEIETLQEILLLLRNLVYFAAGRNYAAESLAFEIYVRDWTNKAACLTLLQWINEVEDGETEEKIGRLRIDLLHKVNPCTPEFIRLCFVAIKVPKLKRSDTIIFGEFVSRFVDFFLENLVVTLKDDARIFREGLILFITFLADPPKTMKHSKLKLIQKLIFAVFDQAVCLLSETSAREKTAVDFRKSIGEVRGKIEKLYVQIPHSSWSNFPRTNGLGYFEALLVYLENLEETMNKNTKLVPFLKHQIFTIKEELMPLRPFLQDILTTQNECKDLKDLHEKIIHLSYQADLAIKSSFSIDHPIWYNLTCLSFIVGEIKDIQYKVMRIKDIQICRTEAIPPLMSSVDVLKAPTSTSTSTSIVEIVVGLNHEIEVLIDRLERGSAQVDIVSIVGMGGIGKTTLAKKLFNEPSIRYHFHKRAFCSVSQEYRKRNVLLDILSDVCTIDDEVRQMSDDDLAHMLKKRLSGFKYLIIMDDIWDINAWYDLRTSFPDDKNGSRVIFTTRINNISLTAKSDSTPYLLPFLSIDESWELLQQKIFRRDSCPPHLCKVGKLIAKNCQGLPLAIVVIAGLLTRTERSLPQWNEVADTLSSFASSEGCKDIIKLSYKQLPEALKSCFLYLGAFCEDEILEAKRLIKLWVAEGFVLKSGSNFLKKVAKKYLNDLGDRNLVTITKRSSNGGIKSFRVHDLIRDFCKSESQEERFFCFVNGHNVNSIRHQYRVCIQGEWRSFVDAKPRGRTVHSLLYFSKAYREENSLKSVLCKFKLVQVLDLQQVEIVGKFPTAVTRLVHLRYLALRFSTALRVPPEIRNLWNLEFLLLFASPVYQAHLCKTRFPNDIWKMKRLRHVETGHEAHVALDDDVSEVLSQLPDLETFTLLYIPPRKDGEELLRRLPNVRKLSCLCNGWWDLRRECNQLPKLDILTNLESLKMICVGEVRHPYMFSFPLTIRKLTLQKFCLPWNEFSGLIGKLTCLEVLVLYNESFSGKRWDMQDDEFPNIKSLTLEDLDIEEWTASTDSFPSLERLAVSFCRRLVEIPPCFGEVQTLKSILVEFCNKGVVDSAIQIQKDQLDSGNQSLEVEH